MMEGQLEVECSESAWTGTGASMVPVVAQAGMSPTLVAAIVVVIVVVAVLLFLWLRGGDEGRDEELPELEEGEKPTADILEDRDEVDEEVEDFEEMSLAEIKRAKMAKVKSKKGRAKAGEATEQAREQFAEEDEAGEAEAPEVPWDEPGEEAAVESAEEMEEADEDASVIPKAVRDKREVDEAEDADEVEEVEEAEEAEEAEEGKETDAADRPEETSKEADESEAAEVDEKEEAEEATQEATEDEEDKEEDEASAKEEDGGGFGLSIPKPDEVAGEKAEEADEEPREEPDEEQRADDAEEVHEAEEPESDATEAEDEVAEADDADETGEAEEAEDVEPTQPADTETREETQEEAEDVEEAEEEEPRAAAADEEGAGEEAEAQQAELEEEQEAQDQRAQREARAGDAPREAEADEAEAEPKSFEKGLEKTREGFIGRLSNLFSGEELSEEMIEDIEEVLFTADIGPRVAQDIIGAVEERLSGDDMEDPGKIWGFIRHYTEELLQSHEAEMDLDSAHPYVIMVVGVNGVGKTTTIGKMASKFKKQGKKVLLVAGDTFRAAAVDQLRVWADRTGLPMHEGKEGADPASVVYDGVEKGVEEDYDVVICDTSGRLHTDENLMDELAKMERVAGKAMDGAPHEVNLVLDANTGQNAIQQAEKFSESLDITGLTLTKFDGTARGGVILGVCKRFDAPVRYVGIGERIVDLRDFDAEEFTEALFM